MDNNRWRQHRNTRTAALVVAHWLEEATAAPQLSLSVYMHKGRGMDKLVEDRKTILRPLPTTIQIGLHATFAANFLNAIIDNHVDQSAENPHAKDLWGRATRHRATRHRATRHRASPQRWRTLMPQPRSQLQAH
jgi:hypothetical protein